MFNIDNQTYNLLKKSLNVTSLRQKIISNNLANLNTKGYKRMYVKFEDTLSKQEDNLQLKLNDKKHISDSYNTDKISVKKDESTSMRQDGNNVNIDSEMVNQAANTLMYEALISEINNKLAMRRSVIRGGK